MAYRAKLRIDVRCPKHIRFNPEIQGPGAIKAACASCQRLWDIHNTVRTLKVLCDGLGPVKRTVTTVPPVVSQ